MLAGSKLNSIESEIFEAIINSETGYVDFVITINEEKHIKN